MYKLKHDTSTIIFYSSNCLNMFCRIHSAIPPHSGWPSLHDFPPSAGGGTQEGVVRVRSSASSSFRPSPHSFPPPAGGCTEEGVVRVRSSASSSSRPSPHNFPPPAGGGTRRRILRPIEHESLLPSDQVLLPSTWRSSHSLAAL